MYTEEYEHKGFPFKNFLIKLFLVIVFVLLLVWILPKFITPTTIVNENGNKSKDNNSSNVAALNSQIFQNNMDKMKEAAISYYTDDRLPSTVGDSKTMTLNEMIKEKIISTLIDKNNKECDGEKSYVKITKLDDEYLLKVNLKDSEQEDYILVHLGCYTYCKGSICEKKTTSTNSNTSIKEAKSDSVVSITPGINETKTNNSTKTTTAENKKSNSTSTSKSSTSKSSSSSSSKSSSTKSSTSTSKSSTSSSNSSKSSSTIKKNSTSSSATDKTAYLYEYKKITGSSFSAWTNWSSWSKTSCDTKEINCNDNDTTCLRKLQLYSRKEQIGTYQKKYTQTRQVLKQTGSYEVKACSNYNYVIVNNTTYATTTTTTYSTINNVTYQTKSNVCSSSSSCSWSYAGRSSYANPPRDTATTHYVFAGADYSYCAETCTTLPRYYYDKYTINGGATSSTVKVTTPGQTTSSSTTQVTANSTISVTANCGSYVTKTVPIYGTITVSDISTRQEPLYGTVCYQSTKTRTIKEQGSSQTKWSKYDDKTLLNNGWYYTGNKKKA